VQDAAEQYDNARQFLLRQPPESGLLLPLLNTAAIAVELFLKSLSSELIHTPIDDPYGVYRVYAKPDFQRHELVKLFNKIPNDVRDQMERSFATDTSIQTTLSLQDQLSKYENLFAESRYPFEKGADISKFSLMPLMALSAFLRKFVANMRPTDRIEW
jgi:hypothetical protein